MFQIWYAAERFTQYDGNIFQSIGEMPDAGQTAVRVFSREVKLIFSFILQGIFDFFLNV